MSSRAKKALVVVVIAALLIPMLSCIFSSPTFNDDVLALTTDPDKDKDDDQNTVTPPEPTPGEEDKFIPFQYVYYYTYDKKIAEFNFGPDVWSEAEAAVKAGNVKDPIEYITNADGTGDFWYKMQYDPALLSAVALQLDLTGASGEIPILKEELDLPVEERADHAHLRFLADSKAWEAVYYRVRSILLSEGATWWIAELKEYTSAMYMVKDALGVGIPSVVVLDTNNEGGHMLVFRVQTRKDGPFVEVRFRLECGYQPIDPPGWNPPPPTPTPTPSDTPTPTPSDTPTPTPTSTPTPTPKPKDVADDPQNKVDPTEPGADDFKSPNPSNQDPDKTVTEEPTSPASYATPTPPPPVTATPTPKPTSTPAPTAAPQTTTATPTPKPTTGNSSSSGYKPVEDVANNTPAKPVTNEPVSGDVPPPE